MADTTSIASRMEKLAKLKRMKEGMASQLAASPDETPPSLEETSAMAPDFAETAHAEPVFPAEAEISAPEDTPLSDDYSDVFDSSEEAVSPDSPEAWDEEFVNETLSAEIDSSSDEPETTSDARPETNHVNFIMEGLDDNPAAELDESVPESHLEETEAQPNKGLSASALGIDDDAMSDFDEIAALAGAGGIAAVAATSLSDDPTTDEPENVAEDTQIPDFSSKEIEAELLAREFEDEASSELPAEEPETVANAKPTTNDDDADGRIRVSFDESRSTLLNHVSRQMGCSVDDVVVTALDWYLDALFGEDEEAKSA